MIGKSVNGVELIWLTFDAFIKKREYIINGNKKGKNYYNFYVGIITINGRQYDIFLKI